MANEVAKKQQTTPMNINSYMNHKGVQKSIENAIGKANMPRFISSVVSAVQTNPALAECSNSSILAAALLGESLKLPPSPQLGFFYMVGYQNKKTGSKDAQFQIGYRGYIQLAIRSGQYKKIVASEVKEGELKSYNPITEELVIEPIFDEKKRSEAHTIGYYAMLELVTGFRKELYWSKEAMLAHADKYSSAFSLNATTGKYPKVSYADYCAGKVKEKDMWLYSSFWYKDFDGMAKKTMLRQIISKWGIMSPEMQTAYASDMGVIDESGNVHYVDNAQDIEDKVAHDIAENANTEEFVPVDVEVEAKVVEPAEESDVPFS